MKWKNYKKKEGKKKKHRRKSGGRDDVDGWAKMEEGGKRGEWIEM